MKTKIVTVIIIIVICIGGYIYYTKKPTTSPMVPGRTDDSVLCTADVQECPDGSFVSRIPPSCAFAECPSGARVDVQVELE